MTSISPSSYYSLSNSQLSASSGTAASTTSASPIQTLINELDASQSNSGNDAFTLDLSPTAQQLLSGNSSSSASGSSSSTSFTLSTQDVTTIQNILEKYKNAPFDQATFDSIQNDLESAGLGADQLSAKDQINSFNPTSTFLSALNGNYTDISNTATSTANEQTKATNYMQSIIKEWQSISATASASGTASS